MTYRIRLLAVALVAIAAIGLTAGLKPPGYIWLLALQFLILIASFALFVIRQRSDHALDLKISPPPQGIDDTMRWHQNGGQ